MDELTLLAIAVVAFGGFIGYRVDRLKKDLEKRMVALQDQIDQLTGKGSW